MTADDVAAVVADLTEPTTVRDIVARSKGAFVAETKQDLSRIGIALKSLGWRRGAQVAGSKGSYWWWPPR